MVTRDHILSRMMARKLSETNGFRRSVQQVNILMCCAICNEEKDQMTLVQFLAEQRVGSMRAVSIAAVIEDLRVRHPQDVFEALTGSGKS